MIFTSDICSNHGFIFLYMWFCLSVYVCLYVHMCVCVCVCVCMHVHVAMSSVCESVWVYLCFQTMFSAMFTHHPQMIKWIIVIVMTWTVFPHGTGVQS